MSSLETTRLNRSAPFPKRTKIERNASTLTCFRPVLQNLGNHFAEIFACHNRRELFHKSVNSEQEKRKSASDISFGPIGLLEAMLTGMDSETSLPVRSSSSMKYLPL